jgi:nitrate/TMAO reductase-like tetraheme cytochrome c subunit
MLKSILFCGLFACMLGISPTIAQERSNTISLPQSLAQWYKPVNKRQVWLHTMFSLRRSLQAVEEYALAGDLELARKWARKIDEKYRQLGEMVPEWKDRLDLERLERLNRVAESGDFTAIRSAARDLSEQCRGCHEDYQALVALKYRTPDFSAIDLFEGLPGGKYPQFMQRLSRTVNRIRIAAEDSRWKAAGEAGYQLEDELGVLSHSCIQCHQERDPYERIFGGKTRKAFTDLQRAIAREDVDKLRMSLGEAAVLACARCHSVHKLGSDLKKRLFEH